MKICAIISEFNPFHLGHQKLIEEAKAKTNCDFLFCFMGQNFTQRAEPAILNKQTRAKMAVLGGCDAVFEIPNALTICNAEIFATIMIKAIASFPHITHLCFGSECGRIEPIIEVAKFLNKEPKAYKDAIKSFLNEGNSLNSAKQKALNYVIDNNLCKFKYAKEAKTLLSLPNNILAVEYAKVVLQQNLNIEMVTIKRDRKISATKIRENCFIGNFKKTKDMLGENSYNIMAKAQTIQAFPNLKLFGYTKLVNARLEPENLKFVLDVSEGLDKKIVKEAQKRLNYGGFLTATSGRRYTKNRIERIMLASVLELDKQVIEKALRRKKLPYIKVVCVKRNRKLMPELTKSKSCIVLRKSDADFILGKSKLARELNETDNKCEYFYSLLTQKKANKNNLYVKTEFIK